MMFFSSGHLRYCSGKKRKEKSWAQNAGQVSVFCPLSPSTVRSRPRSHDTAQWHGHMTLGAGIPQEMKCLVAKRRRHLFSSGLQILKETLVRKLLSSPLPLTLTILATQSVELVWWIAARAVRRRSWNDVSSLAETQQIKIQQWLTASGELGHLGGRGGAKHQYKRKERKAEEMKLPPCLKDPVRHNKWMHVFL